MKPRVVIVDDHQMFRAGVRVELGDTVELLGDAADVTSAVQLIRATVPDDRRGIAESVVGRMSRHGGHAVVRSAPGEGTEVELQSSRVLL